MFSSPQGVLTIAWLVWCFLHSVFISERWLVVVKRMMKSWFVSYRLFYSLFSGITMLILLLFEWSLDATPLFVWHFPWNIVRYVSLLLFGIIFYLAAKEYDQRFFFGLSQIMNRNESGITEKQLNRNGILSLIRHPYYLAGMLLVPMYSEVTDVSVFPKSIIVLYFIVGAFIEERKLVREFPVQYSRYKDEVAMFIPSWKAVTSFVRRTISL